MAKFLVQCKWSHLHSEAVITPKRLCLMCLYCVYNSPSVPQIKINSTKADFLHLRTSSSYLGQVPNNPWDRDEYDTDVDDNSDTIDGEGGDDNGYEF